VTQASGVWAGSYKIAGRRLAEKRLQKRSKVARGDSVNYITDLTDDERAAFNQGGFLVLVQSYVKSRKWCAATLAANGRQVTQLVHIRNAEWD